MKKIRKLLYSDLHLQMIDPLGSPTDDGLTTRIHQKLKSLDKVIDIAIKEEANEIVDLGDLFSHINPPSKLRNAYARTVKRALDFGIGVTRIAGNHETDGKEGVGFDTGILGKDFYRVIANIDMCFDLPIMYIPEIEEGRILEALDTRGKGKIVFGHFGVAGLRYSNGVEESQGLPLSMFSGDDFPSFLGHIHKRQFLCGGNVVYIGALCRANFGDREIKPGCCLVEFGVSDGGDIETADYKFIDVPDIDLLQYEIVESRGDDCWTPVGPNFDILADKDWVGCIVKIKYTGAYDWFSTMRVNEIVKNLKDNGIGKVVVDFNPISSVKESVLDLDKEVDYEELITKRAEEDKQDAEAGLRYFRKAVEDAIY